MKKTILKSFSALTLIVCLAFSSCQKEKLNTVADKPSTSAKQASSIEQLLKRTTVILSVLNNGSVSYKNGGFIDYSPCASVNIDSTSMPRVTVINYGESGCVGLDGVTRMGKVVITSDGDSRDAGTYIVTTYSHYFEDGDEITGSDTMHNDGKNINGNISYSMSQNTFSKLANGSGNEKEVFAGTCEWLTGEATETTDDDQYGYTFVGNITSPDGSVETLTSQTQLVKNLAPNCSVHFVQGKILSHHATYDVFVDFGDGTCDNLVSVTENGTTTTYDLN